MKKSILTIMCTMLLTTFGCANAQTNQASPQTEPSTAETTLPKVYFYRGNHSPAKVVYHHKKFPKRRLDVFSKFVQKIFVFVQNMNGSSARLQNSDSSFPFRPAEQFTKARVKHKPHIYRMNMIRTFLTVQKHTPKDFKI